MSSSTPKITSVEELGQFDDLFWLGRINGSYLLTLEAFWDDEGDEDEQEALRMTVKKGKMGGAAVSIKIGFAGNPEGHAQKVLADRVAEIKAGDWSFFGNLIGWFLSFESEEEGGEDV